MLIGGRRRFVLGALVAAWWGSAASAVGAEQPGASPQPRDVATAGARQQGDRVRNTRRPGGLSDAERQALLEGQTVVRPMRLEYRGGRYVGGLSYQLVKASVPELVTALLTVNQLPQLLPRTKRARLVDSNGNRSRVELVQGNSLIEATYTVHLERDVDPAVVRFWLDPSRPHDIRDVWGYFRVHPFGAARSVVTVAVALDVGDGLVRMLFEDRIQRVILDTPRHIRDFLEPRALAAVVQ